MQLDPRVELLGGTQPRGVIGLPVERQRIHFDGGLRGADFRRFARVQRLIALRKGRDVIVGDFLAGFVGAAVAQRQLQPAQRGIGDHHCLRGQRDPRTIAAFRRARGTRIRRRDVCQENSLPAPGQAGRDVRHIENRVGKLFLENARLHVGGQPSLDQLILHPVPFANGPGRQPQRGRRRDAHRHASEKQDGRYHALAGHSRRAHGDDLAVRRHAR